MEINIIIQVVLIWYYNFVTTNFSVHITQVSQTYNYVKGIGGMLCVVRRERKGWYRKIYRKSDIKQKIPKFHINQRKSSYLDRAPQTMKFVILVYFRVIQTLCVGMFECFIFCWFLGCQSSNFDKNAQNRAKFEL